MSVLVTGGAGYIGSVTTEALRLQGLTPVVLDNLVYGHRDAVNPQIAFYQGDIGDRVLVEEIVRTHGVSACIHFAAFAYVGESVEKPAKYFENNVAKTIALLESLQQSDVKKFVFSSTCASYGEPQYVPIDEKHPQSPTNPYGWSKFMVERILESYDRSYGMKSVALRYFNAAGATESLGEDHDPETHLIPLVLKTALGQRDSISIFGDDYSTPDGTAIRDYIHVSDLSQAHLKALKYIDRTGNSDVFNLGNGEGYSVKQVIDTSKKITGIAIKTEVAPRRAGDPSRLVADAKKAGTVLGWKPEFPKLEEIIESAWKWHKNFPNGYGR
ncbi:MAG: UDP-glucose 4-epimerase GalE [Pyrinomonadaceae bacterium]|nr:UDP-glucose 4-epimerase GalE [Pyrinomonadaceae bacterium]